VAVLDPEVQSKYQLREQDVDIQTTRGSGPGGQNRNKVESCVVVTHKETGLKVRVDMKSQHQGKTVALQILGARLQERASAKAAADRDAARKEQCGSGMRGDKVRTYRTQDDRVTDHRSNKTWSLKTWMRGDWNAC
jgi:peptide chain release factor 1